MLHHLLPDEVEPGSLVPNLDFYEPRTAHGSSLSPGIHAALFARAGRGEEALRWLRVAADVDLDDLTTRPPAGCISRRWAASGRRSPGASGDSDPLPTRSSWIRASLRSGEHSNCAFASTAHLSASVSSARRRPSSPLDRSASDSVRMAPHACGPDGIRCRTR